MLLIPHPLLPPVHAHMSIHRDAKFLHVDVDEVSQAAAAAGIRGIPAFHFHKGGRKVDEFSGADPTRLEATIVKNLGSGSGKEAAGSVSRTTSHYPKGQNDLDEFVVKNQLECLNQTDDHTVKDLFGAGYVQSDADEQLLITVQFSTAIKLHSLELVCNGAPELAPKTVKLFINNTSMDFDNATSDAPVQVLNLDPAQVAPPAGDAPSVLIPLKFVKLQNLTSVTLFVEDNQGGGDVTRLDSVKFIGQPRDGMKVGELKKMGEGMEVAGQKV